MKKTMLALCLFIGMTAVSSAQMTEGVINYDMEFSSDNPEMAMGLSMVQGSKMTMSFMPGKSRTDMKMGTIGTVTTITDEKSKKVLSLMDMMGQKTAVEAPMEETAATDTPKYTVEITKETKKIAGYDCTKAIMHSEEMGDMTVWFTKDVKAVTKGLNYFSDQMPGFPMEFTVGQAETQMQIHMVATTIEKKAVKGSFEQKIPEGYQVKSAEEMQMMGQ